MATVQLTMAPSVEAFLHGQATRNGLTSAREYLQSILDELESRVQAKRELDASLLEAIRSPHVDGDAAFWAERRRKVLERSPEL